MILPLMVTAMFLRRPMFEDQIINTVIPFGVVQQAADAWGVPVIYGGPPGCKNSPPNVQVICMSDTSSRWYLGEWFINGQGIVVSPRLASLPRWKQVEVLEHEMGNALGVPEQPCGAHNVMSRCVDGFLNTP